MARTPEKTCPNLFRLFEDAEPRLQAAFLGASAFERFKWLDAYRFDPADAGAVSAAAEMLRREKKERLGPLETEAARVVTVAGTRGWFALEGLARAKLDPGSLATLIGQWDYLGRSLWTYIHQYALFEATENSLHQRLYRRYDKHYQTFMAEPSGDGDRRSDRDVLDTLLDDLKERLDRGDGYNFDRFDIPAEDDEPAAELYMLFHPNPPTSVREIDDAGNRSRIYFRPPGEAMVVYTPSTGRVHVRAGTRLLRHAVAESFIEKVLDQAVSHQPVDFQAYDVSRFFAGFALDTPHLQDVVILSAQVIRAEVSIGNLGNRLSLSTTIDQDIMALIEGQPGLGRIFERAIAIRFIEIAVRYRRTGEAREQTLDFTLTDRNTSSLLSIEDSFERVLGHRLLRAWGILREGRAPSQADSAAALPALLALWDTGAERVTGAWLQARHVDPGLLTEAGFLVPAGWEGDDVIDDEDDLGPVAAEVVPEPDNGVELRASEGQEAPGASLETYRVYRVRDDWVAQHLRDRVAGFLDSEAIEEINANLLALGMLQIDDRDVPVYLARCLDDERKRAAIDTELRARHDQGIGLVLQAGHVVGSCLAANVLASLPELVDGDGTEISLTADRLRTIYRRNRSQARGGLTVDLVKTGENAATLFVPDKGSIHISGKHPIVVIERLVKAQNQGPAPVATQDLVEGIADQSLANIFNQPLWNKLKANFVRSPRKGLWEIAT